MLIVYNGFIQLYLYACIKINKIMQQSYYNQWEICQFLDFEARKNKIFSVDGGTVNQKIIYHYNHNNNHKSL